MLKNRLILISFGGALVANIVLWAVLLSKFGLRDVSIPLHFNIISGIDLVGSSRQVYQVPALGVVILVTNFLLAGMLPPGRKLLGSFFALASLLAQLILAVTTALLLSLNT